MPCFSELISFNLIANSLNSAFVTTLLGALTGAYFGASAAQKIAERSREKELLIHQIRNTNAAITVAWSICNSALSFKTQHIKPLCDSYRKARADHQKFILDKKSGVLNQNEKFRFVADLRYIHKSKVPLESLQKLAFEKLSVASRILATVTTLISTYDSLETLISSRNTQVEKLKEVSTNDIPYFYFGLPSEKGELNSEYPDLMNSIEHLINWTSPALLDKS
jgi:hypothetical protein